MAMYEVRYDEYTGQAIADHKHTFDWWSLVPLKVGVTYYVHNKRYGCAIPLLCLSSVSYAGDRWRNVGVYEELDDEVE